MINYLPAPHRSKEAEAREVFAVAACLCRMGMIQPRAVTLIWTTSLLIMVIPVICICFAADVYSRQIQCVIIFCWFVGFSEMGAESEGASP